MYIYISFYILNIYIYIFPTKAWLDWESAWKKPKGPINANHVWPFSVSDRTKSSNYQTPWLSLLTRVWDRESARALAAALLHRDVDHACYQFPVFATRLAAVPKKCDIEIDWKNTFLEIPILVFQKLGPNMAPTFLWFSLQVSNTLLSNISVLKPWQSFIRSYISHHFQSSRVEENTRSTK